MENSINNPSDNRQRREHHAEDPSTDQRARGRTARSDHDESTAAEPQVSPSDRDDARLAPEDAVDGGPEPKSPPTFEPGAVSVEPVMLADSETPKQVMADDAPYKEMFAGVRERAAETQQAHDAAIVAAPPPSAMSAPAAPPTGGLSTAAKAVMMGAGVGVPAAIAAALGGAESASEAATEALSAGRGEPALGSLGDGATIEPPEGTDLVEEVIEAAGGSEPPDVAELLEGADSGEFGDPLDALTKRDKSGAPGGPGDGGSALAPTTEPSELGGLMDGLAELMRQMK